VKYLVSSCLIFFFLFFLVNVVLKCGLPKLNKLLNKKSFNTHLWIVTPFLLDFYKFVVRVQWCWEIVSRKFKVSNMAYNYFIWLMSLRR